MPIILSFLFLTSRIWLSFAYRPRTLLPIYKIPPSVIIDVQKVSIGYKKTQPDLSQNSFLVGFISLKIFNSVNVLNEFCFNKFTEIFLISNKKTRAFLHGLLFNFSVIYQDVDQVRSLLFRKRH